MGFTEIDKIKAKKTRKQNTFWFCVVIVPVSLHIVECLHRLEKLAEVAATRFMTMEAARSRSM